MDKKIFYITSNSPDLSADVWSCLKEFAYLNNEASDHLIPCTIWDLNSVFKFVKIKHFKVNKILTNVHANLEPELSTSQVFTAKFL